MHYNIILLKVNSLSQFSHAGKSGTPSIKYDGDNKMEFHLTKKKVPALKIELINGRGNFLYLSLVEYKRETYLCIIDNISSSSIGAFVLDYAEQENVKTNMFLSVVTKWFYAKSDLHPLSVELARLGLTQQVAPIYRTFDTSYVSRIIGNPFSYDALQKSKVKRRRVIPIPEGIPITFKKGS